MAKPEWLSITRKIDKRKLPTRTIIKKHLKEWNFDDEGDEYDKFHKDYDLIIKQQKAERDILKALEEED